MNRASVTVAGASTRSPGTLAYQFSRLCECCAATWRPAPVVSRGGRPDLASASLASVRAPTLLVVGGADSWVLDANREAAARLTAPHEVAVVSGATHLFEEPGALDAVARLAADWFIDHFAHVTPAPAPAHEAR